MLGRQKSDQRQFMFEEPSVPKSRARELLLAVDGLIDWELVRGNARPYFSDRGRPSIDPVLMVKMMLIGYLFGVESDRQLVEECADRLSFREFLGVGMSDSLPVHSSFTHWRERLGSGFFREFLHHVVRLCAAGGMEFSEARTVDGTLVKAQADNQGPTTSQPKVRSIDQYVEEYDAGETVTLPKKEHKTVANKHDRDARMQRKKGQPAKFRYNASFCADAETGIITDATATGTERAETAVDHVDHDPFPVTELVADGGYDSAIALHGLQRRGVMTYVPMRQRSSRDYFSSHDFTYDRQRDEFTCPAGNRLRWSRFRDDRRLHYYIALKSDCDACQLKKQCTKAKRRTVTRVLCAAALDRCVRGGLRYSHLMARRRINEHLNMLGKRDHGLQRARSLGLEAMRIQTRLTAVAINLLKFLRWQGRPAPARESGVLSASRGLLYGLHMGLLRVLGRFCDPMKPIQRQEPSSPPTRPSYPAQAAKTHTASC